MLTPNGSMDVRGKMGVRGKKSDMRLGAGDVEAPVHSPVADIMSLSVSWENAAEALPLGTLGNKRRMYGNSGQIIRIGYLENCGVLVGNLKWKS